MATTASTNAHFTADYRLERKKDLSSQFCYGTSYNVALTRARDLDRYRTAYSSKTNIYDNARTISPTNYFGIRHIRDWDRIQHYAPAGMNGECSTQQTGSSFTKPFVRSFSIF
jgi:hypothetical protein